MKNIEKSKSYMENLENSMECYCARSLISCYAYMNKYLILPLTLISISASNVTANDIIRPEPTDMPNQHTIVLSLSAKFRCGLRRWPTDLAELKAFQEVNEIQLGVESNWGWLLTDEVTYTKSKKKMNLISISKGIDGKTTTVKSVQKKPLCKNGATEIRGANIAIDFGDKDA